MAGRFSHPFRVENSLRRAEDLIVVGQKFVALDQLHDVITGKKRMQWQPALEKIMLKYVELCVELKKARLAREGLHSYKSVCQNGPVQSLELVVRRLLELAELRVNSAQEKAEKIVLDFDDLEASETPESIMMRTVTGEDTKDRADRQEVMPWLKFLWETYRTVLDVLRNNVKLEPLYQATTQQAFQFCLKYQRKTEFRRLCEIIRQHLSNLTKYTNKPNNAISLSNPESLQMHLDTRFSQLNVAVVLELWQEAFRSVDDLHGLMIIAKKQPKPSVMANYYDQLTKIFLVAENFLMHAFAYKRYFNTISKSVLKTFSPEDRRALASVVLLAALAVPIESAPRVNGYLETEDSRNRNQRLASLLGMNKAPSRELLLKDLLSREILEQVNPEIRDLYNILEVDFHPLSLCKKLDPIVEQLKKEERYARYIKPLQDVALTRLLQQLSQIYKTISLKSIADLATFSTPYTIEKFAMETCKRGDLQLRINHQTQSVTFGTALFDAAEDGVGGGSLQTSEFRTQLAQLSQRLQVTTTLLAPVSQTDLQASRHAEIQTILAGLPAEHTDALKRKTEIEARKEQLEKYLEQKEHSEASEKAARLRREAEAERVRLAEEARRREQDRLQREREEIDLNNKMRLAAEMKRKSEAVGIKLDIEDLKDLDTDQLVAKQVEQLEQEKKEMRVRLNALAKRLDHTERAYRREEIPLLLQDFEKQKIEDLKFHQEQIEQARQAAKEQFERDQKIRNRISRILEDAHQFRESILSQRREDWQQRRAEADAKLAAEKAKRRAELVHKREEEERRKQEEEERRRAKDEAEAQQREQEEQRRRDLEERKAAEQRKPDEIPEKRDTYRDDRRDDRRTEDRRDDRNSRDERPAHLRFSRSDRPREDRPRDDRPRDDRPRDDRPRDDRPRDDRPRDYRSRDDRPRDDRPRDDRARDDRSKDERPAHLRFSRSDRPKDDRPRDW